MNKVKLSAAIRFSIVMILLALGTLKIVAQPTHQDCKDAIPICGLTYTETNSYIGTGFYPNEINGALSACTTPQFIEQNSAWYIFTCQTPGPFGFLLTPANPTADFNYAVFKQSGTSTCTQIYTQSGGAVEVACNTDATAGQTGMCGGVGPQFGSMVNAAAGDTYVICISDWNATGGGYTLDFTCSTSQINDNVPPHMSSISAPVNCLATLIKVRFSEMVLCSSVTPACFFIHDNQANLDIPITSITSTNCTLNAPYDNFFTFNFTPGLSHAGTYVLHMNANCVTDLCGNIAAAGTLPFNVAGVTVVAHHTAAGCTCVGTDWIHVNTGLGPFTYTWSCSASTSATISGLCAGDICTCTVHGASGCPGIVIDTIPSGSTFVLTTSSLPSGCTNPTGQAVASPTNGVGPYSFVWSPNVSTSDTAFNLASGTYLVTVTDAGTGCTATASIVVSSGGGFSVTASATNVNCQNALNGSVNSLVVGNGVYTYLWSPSNATTGHVLHLGPNIYTVTVTDSATGCTATATCTINIITVMHDTAFSSGVCCATAHNAVVWTVVTGNPAGYPYLYHWSPSNASTATVSNLTVTNYNVTVTDTNGCTSTASVTPQVTGNMTNTQVMNNPSCSTAGFCEAFPSGCTGTFTHHWSTGSASFLITNLAAGTYSDTITNTTSGCQIISTYVLTLTSNLTITMHSTNVLCHGGSSGTAWETIGNGNNTGYTYTWTPTGGNSATASNLNAGNYTVTFSQSGGCTAIGYVTITEPPPLYISMNNISSTCGQPNGSAIAIPDSGTGPYSYHWGTNPVQTNDTASNLVQGTYHVTVTDVNGCTITDSTSIGSLGGPTATITAHTDVSCFGGADGTAIGTAVGGTGPYTYTWNSAPVQVADTAINLPVGFYTMIATDATGCTSTDTVTLISPTAVTLVVGGATTECVGQIAVITATAAGGVGGYIYTWSNGGTGSPLSVAPLVTTTYTCTATDLNGCNSPAESITIAVLPPITVTAFGPTDTVCAGKHVSLTATASGGNNGPFSYTWTPGGMSGNPVTVSPTITTTYTCSVNDGCTMVPGTTVIAVEVIPVPLVNFHGSNVVGCDPLTVTFANLSLNVRTGSTYSWDFGGLGTDTAKNPQFTFRASGLFDITLTIITPEGCTTTMTDTNGIDVFPKPIAIIVADPTIATKSNAYINFYNNSVGADYWDWNFGDLRNHTSTIKDPSFTYLDTGMFTANLVVTNLFGCTDTAYVNIHIKDDFSFFIPSAFSPDADGVNDYFTPTGINVTDYIMVIYDRFGNEIFQTTDLSIPWDGTVGSGEKAPENVYVYWIESTDRDGNKHQYTGRVTLLR